MKPWYKSKTLWFQVLTVLVGVTGAVVGYIRNEIVLIVFVAVTALINAILRVAFTDTAIK